MPSATCVPYIFCNSPRSPNREVRRAKGGLSISEEATVICRGGSRPVPRGFGSERCRTARNVVSHAHRTAPLGHKEGIDCLHATFSWQRRDWGARSAEKPSVTDGHSRVLTMQVANAYGYEDA